MLNVTRPEYWGSSIQVYIFSSRRPIRDHVPKHEAVPSENVQERLGDASDSFGNTTAAVQSERLTGLWIPSWTT